MFLEAFLFRGWYQTFKNRRTVLFPRDSYHMDLQTGGD